MRITLKKAAATVLAVLLGSTAVQAAPSGTLVANTISMSYNSGGNTISDPAAASVSFVIDQKVDLSVTGMNAGGVVYGEPSEDVVSLTYMVQNKGNDPSGYDINVTKSGTVDLVYDATGAGAEGTYYVKVSTSANPADPGTIYDTAGTINAGDLAAGTQYYVHIIANLRETAINLQSGDFLVRASALEPSSNTLQAELSGQGLSGIDIVFGDPGENGYEEATQQISVAGAELTASKTVTVISENLHGGFNCAAGAQVVGAENAVPGACVEYLITVSNGPGATRSGVNLAINDTLPADVTYVGHTATGFTTSTHAAGVVSGTIASLDPGQTATLRIRATIGN